ncbi:transcriptional regulator [Galactobacter valiniphilus]|uniref:transcriptional regulator n=1 Tax=Galactobacter valiniphilus TaxID=2676122 RepID=UPI003736D548
MTDPWDHSQLAAARAGSPLAALVPLAHALLGGAAREAGVLLVVTDPSGRLLWLDGADADLAEAEGWGLVAGTEWALVGGALSGLGRALATKAPSRSPRGPGLPQPFAAVAVRDPRQGTLCGALGITGGDAALAPFVLAALRGAAATLESHLATTALPAGPAVPVGSASAHALLRLTGPDAPTLDTPHGTSSLGRRHAELLAVLAAAPAGLDGAELVRRVYSQPVSGVTLRAEIARLRKALEESGALDAGVSLGSRPYRLSGVEDDATRVAAHLARGALVPALNEYGGELLPGSDAPEILRRRAELSTALRGAVLGSAQAEALSAFLALPEAAQDAEAWAAAAQLMPSGSPRRATAEARLAALRAR